MTTVCLCARVSVWGVCACAQGGGRGGGCAYACVYSMCQLPVCGDVRMRVCMQCVSYHCVCPGGVTVCVTERLLAVLVTVLSVTESIRPRSVSRIVSFCTVSLSIQWAKYGHVCSPYVTLTCPYRPDRAVPASDYADRVMFWIQ